eukprot:g32484.t1
MKYVKRLWERSAFMAQRGFHCKEHFQMLEALKPIFRHWAAQLAQISAHAETLLNMLESTRVSKNVQQQRDAIEDLNVLGSDVEVLYEKCQSLTDDPAAEEGVKCLQEVLDLLDPFQPYADADVEKVMDVLKQEDHEAIPTILAGDLNFPEEAIRPLLNKRDGKMENVKFVPIPYPTNICQGSLLPKRIDCIALLSGHEMVKVKPLSAENVLPGLADMVKLLESRSWELAEVKMDMREQAYQAR